MGTSLSAQHQPRAPHGGSGCQPGSPVALHQPQPRATEPGPAPGKSQGRAFGTPGGAQRPRGTGCLLTPGTLQQRPHSTEEEETHQTEALDRLVPELRRTTPTALWLQAHVLLSEPRFSHIQNGLHTLHLTGCQCYTQLYEHRTQVTTQP